MTLVHGLNASGEVPDAAGDRIAGRLTGVSIPFIVNSGQVDSAVAYYAPTFAGTVYVTRAGQIVYSLPGEEDPGTVDQSSSKPMSWSLTETAVGGRTRLISSDPVTTRVSYFLGNDPARWKKSLSTFGAVSLGEVWPRISLRLHAHGKNVEKVFTVEPRGDPSQIRMRVGGAWSLCVNEAGALVVGTSQGDVVFSAPVAFQEHEGVRRLVSAAYELHGWAYGFRLGDYDPALPLLIDPLLQATYLGGNAFDLPLALAIHPNTGDVYVAGLTGSTVFPGTTGGAQPIIGSEDGAYDGFVARYNADLTTLHQVTYLGGNDGDAAFALAIHPISGEVYVAGGTSSRDFPGIAGGAQTTMETTAGDIYVARLNPALTMLNQATYLGGNVTDSGLALAIHPTTGEVYVAGYPASGDFPGTTGGAQTVPASASIARLNASLTQLLQATYLGGTNGDTRVLALAISSNGDEVYAAGTSTSTSFPGTAGGAQPINGGGSDAFVARLNTALTNILQATYLGGSNDEKGLTLAVHPTSGEPYVAGVTSSMNFPGTAGGAQPMNGGGGDVFVAHLNTSLTILDRATYLGGSGYDEGRGLAIHPTSGEVYVGGRTQSTNFPGTADGAQPIGGDDAFAARLNVSLTTINQATYLGGDHFDEGLAIGIHPTTGDVYVSGSTSSTDFPGTAGGAQPESFSGSGGADAFVACLSSNLAGPSAGPTALVPTLSAQMLVFLALSLVAVAMIFLRKSA